VKDTFNVIKKQIFQLSVPAGADNFRLQQRVSEHAQGKMLAQLQTLFDELVDEEDMLVIDRIEIDLGQLAPDDIETGGWSMELVGKLKEYIIKALASAGTVAGPQRGNKAIGHFRQWLLYMQNGYLPWNVVRTDAAWQQNVLQTLATDIRSIAELRQAIAGGGVVLSRIVLQHPQTFLVGLLETLTAEGQDELPAFLEEVYLIFSVASEEALGSARYQPFRTGDKKVFLARIWEFILTSAARSEPHLTAPALIEKVIRKFPVDAPLLEKIRTRLPEGLILVKPVLDSLEASFPGIGKKRTGESPAPADKIDKPSPKEEKVQDPKDSIAGDESKEQGKPRKDPPDEAASPDRKIVSGGDQKDSPVVSEQRQAGETIRAGDVHSIETALAGSGIAGVPPDAAAPVTEDRKEALAAPSPAEKEKADRKDMPPAADYSESIGEEGIFVQHAGLVLLHPFLSLFFKRLELVAEGRFVDQEARQKAIHLLHYLASGEKFPDEHLLVVGKVLCAHPIHHPVVKELELSDDDTEEADHLLQVVIDRWEILKSASPDGLREGFLQRRGKLFRKNDSICLQVESSSIDILLDHLPWNIAIIKLPWMKEMIRVEWR
jgi:hypothetical protein